MLKFFIGQLSDPQQRITSLLERHTYENISEISY